MSNRHYHGKNKLDNSNFPSMINPEIDNKISYKVQDIADIERAKG